MGKIVKADAWCNGEVAYLAWQADGPIADCLGFMITRVRETGPTGGQAAHPPDLDRVPRPVEPGLARSGQLGLADPVVRVARPDAPAVA